MIKLTFKHAQDQWIEATWTQTEQAPDVVAPATPDRTITLPQHEIEPGVFDTVLRTQIIPGTPEVITPGQITKTDLKHTSYHPTQIDLLQADANLIGTPLDEHADMLADWVLSYVPPKPEPVPVPQVLTARQAKRVLLAAGWLDDVDAAVASADRATQIDWEYAMEVRRDWPALISMAQALGMTSAQLDGLFVAGAQL